MKTYRWLTLVAALLITVLEAWAFAGASANASPVEFPAAIATNAPATGDAP